MRICGTYFPHKQIHQITHQSATAGLRQIDHMLIETRDFKGVLDIRSHRDATINSDHYLVRARLIQVLPKQTRPLMNNKLIRYNVMKLKDESTAANYQRHINERLLSDTTAATNVEDAWLKIKSAIQAAAMESLGVAPKPSKESWFDKECEQKAMERKNMKAKMNRQATRARIQEYQKLNKSTTRLFRNKKREHIRRFVSQIGVASQERDPRTMYNNIKKIKGGWQPRNCFIKNEAGDLLTSPEEIVEGWRQYYNNLLNDSSSNTEEGDITTTVEETNNTPTLEEVKEALNHLKCNKSPGEDGIPTELMQKGGEILSINMHELIQLVWKQETMPKEWSTSIIVSLHKKGDRTNCNNYRGLSMLNTAYKVLSRVIYKRLETSMNIICGEYQAGFRTNRGTTDHIFTIRQVIEKCAEFNIDIHMLFIDFKKAYDSIKRSAIWKALQHLGIDQKLIRMTQLTLANSNSKIKASGALSKSCQIGVGLRDVLVCKLN